MPTIARRTAVVAGVWLSAAMTAVPAHAHDAPDDGLAAWVMADWMLMTFAVFFVSGVTAFVVALKRGWMTNIEQAKYHMLTIPEPDYYTPDWAKEDALAMDDTSPGADTDR